MTTRSTTTPSRSAVVDVRGLTVTLAGPDGPVPVLSDIYLTVAPGEAVGVVGESGSGKSMTLRSLAGILPVGARVTGAVRVGDVDVLAAGRKGRRELRRTLGFVFQDPRSAINPVHSVGSFLAEAVKDSGGDLPAARARTVDLLNRMGVNDPERRLGQYPFELSGGLLQRVMIASVLQTRPLLLLADEPTTALDVTTQSDVLALTEDLRREQGTAMLFVTHDLDLAQAVCDRVVVIYAGRVIEVATRDLVATGPRHPYTRGLLASRPPMDRRLAHLPVLEGTPISLAASGPGCPFEPRCPVRLPVCRTTLPVLEEHPQGAVRCHRAVEIARGDLDDQLARLSTDPAPEAAPGV